MSRAPDRGPASPGRDSDHRTREHSAGGRRAERHVHAVTGGIRARTCICARVGKVWPGRLTNFKGSQCRVAGDPDAGVADPDGERWYYGPDVRARSGDPTGVIRNGTCRAGSFYGSHLESQDKIADAAEDGEKAEPHDQEGGSSGNVLL